MIKFTSALEQYNVERVYEDLLQVVTAEDPAWLLLDFGDVPFVDSQGIGFWVRLQQALADLHCPLYLAALNKNVRDGFDFTNLFAHFHISESVGQAKQAAQEAAAHDQDC